MQSFTNLVGIGSKSDDLLQLKEQDGPPHHQWHQLGYIII